MITVKLLGGTKSHFLSEKLEFEIERITVADLLAYLQKSIPKNMPLLDIQNILVAVNGVDSSALSGNNTILKNGDVISIIPVVHGGTMRRTSFGFGINCVELLRLTNTDQDPIHFLETLRQKYPDLAIQGVQSRYILNARHAKKVVGTSLAAKKADVLLSNKIETDIIMRFAFTRQINDAIKKVGLQKDQEFILIVIGKKSSINRLFKEIKNLMQPFEQLGDNSKFIKKEYSITKKQLDCIISTRPLEDLLSEKSAVLFH